MQSAVLLAELCKFNYIKDFCYNVNISKLVASATASNFCCNLQVQFLPDIVTTAAGHEIARTSFLGPFLGISVFAEDEPKVAERFFSGNTIADKSLHTTLQQELDNSRVRFVEKLFSFLTYTVL